MDPRGIPAARAGFPDVPSRRALWFTRPVTAFQLRWLVVFWIGFAAGALLFLEATFAFAEGAAGVGAWVTTALGTIAALLAALAATRLARVRVTDLWFVKGTGAARAIAIGWGGVAILVPVGAVLAALTGIGTDELASTIGPVTGTLGSVALLAMLGPGYGEFREALHQSLGDESAAGLKAALRARRATRVEPATPVETDAPGA